MGRRLFTSITVFYVHRFGLQKCFKFMGFHGLKGPSGSGRTFRLPLEKRTRTPSATCPRPSCTKVPFCSVLSGRRYTSGDATPLKSWSMLQLMAFRMKLAIRSLSAACKCQKYALNESILSAYMYVYTLYILCILSLYTYICFVLAFWDFESSQFRIRWTHSHEGMDLFRPPCLSFVKTQIQHTQTHAAHKTNQKTSETKEGKMVSGRCIYIYIP